MNYNKAAFKAIEKVIEESSELESDEPRVEIYKYDSGFNDKPISDRDVEFQRRLAVSHSNYHAENDWDSNWGRKPPRAQASDHYGYWREKYDDNLQSVFYRVKNLVDEDHTDSLEFEDFTDFAYSCSSGYFSD